MASELASIPVPIDSASKTDPSLDAGAELFRNLKKTHGMYAGAEVEHIDRQLPARNHLVQDLIPPCSVNILVGDSGIGKSPLAYQLALSVAAGIPFLGMAVHPVKGQPAKVLFLDYENHLPDVHWIVTHQRKHLGLARVPDNFLFWPISRDPELEHVDAIIRQLAPDLAIIDSLRAFQPEMECDSRKAVEHLRRLRAISARHGTAFLLIHHVRRQYLANNANLEDAPALDWLRRAAGVRALINQTDVRLAFAKRSPNAHSRNAVPGDMILSGHFRTRGDVGPFLIRRSFDADGEPSGYERFSPEPAMIANPDQEAAFRDLPGDFSFTVAEKTLRKPPESTNIFIHKLIRLGLAQKLARGKYRKTILSPEQPTVQ